MIQLYGATTDASHPDDLQYDPEGGLGFLPGLVVDTHFRYKIEIDHQVRSQTIQFKAGLWSKSGVATKIMRILRKYTWTA